jgi:hypothetical protein
MSMKKLSALILLTGLLAASAFAQSVKPRAGEYLYESDTVRHWVSIEDEGGDRYTVSIVSTNRGLNGGVVARGAYWRPGSGAIEFIYDGRTVQIRAVSGGRAITCNLFGSTTLPRA